MLVNLGMVLAAALGVQGWLEEMIWLLLNHGANWNLPDKVGVNIQYEF